MTTLKEIAQAAGVSMTTVSNVINGKLNRVSADTVERIQALISQSGYVPNQAARSLAQRESRVVAIIVQASENENIFRNPYAAEYVGALTVELHRSGYYPLIRFSDDYRDVEADLRGWNVAGAIFSGTFSRHLQSIHSLKTVPTVLTDCYFRLPGVNHVSVDDDAAGQMAGDYLARMGHRQVALMTNNLQDSEVDQHRLAGFRTGLAAHGITLAERCVFPQPIAAETIGQLTSLLRSPDGPTAIFCTADRIAAQLMQLLSAEGFRVPEDVSVLGFDNLPMAQITHPPLTTLAQDIDQKAHLVVDMLLRHIRQETLAPERTLLGVWLVERQSVRRVGPPVAFDPETTA